LLEESRPFAYFAGESEQLPITNGRPEWSAFGNRRHCTLHNHSFATLHNIYKIIILTFSDPVGRMDAVLACLPTGPAPDFKLESVYFAHCIARLANSTTIRRADLLTAVEATVTLLEAVNGRNYGHSSEVAIIAFLLSRRLKMSCAEQDKVRLAALLHDIGKIKKDDYYGQHALTWAEIIRCNPLLEDVADMVLYHHAGWQGKKAAASPAGDDIPLGARIIAVADAFQKSFFHRQGNREKSDTKILKELRRQAGSAFDPHIVNLVIDNYRLLSKFVGSCHTCHIMGR
jgi:putative nucleotidyltransferase with HDIG domain